MCSGMWIVSSRHPRPAASPLYPRMHQFGPTERRSRKWAMVGPSDLVEIGRCVWALRVGYSEALVPQQQSHLARRRPPPSTPGRERGYRRPRLDAHFDFTRPDTPIGFLCWISQCWPNTSESNTLEKDPTPWNPTPCRILALHIPTPSKLALEVSRWICQCWPPPPSIPLRICACFSGSLPGVRGGKPHGGLAGFRQVSPNFSHRI